MRVCVIVCVCARVKCVHVCVSVWLLHVSAKNGNENSLKSNVTLLRDAAVYLQVPWPFSILSLWKRNKNTPAGNYIVTQTQPAIGAGRYQDYQRPKSAEDLMAREFLVNGWGRRNPS